MVIKTFNIDEEVYKQFSEYCKKNGVSMSKRVENFIREEISKLKIKMPEAETQAAKPHPEKHHFSKYC